VKLKRVGVREKKEKGEKGERHKAGAPLSARQRSSLSAERSAALGSSPREGRLALSGA
jgi:hypothetical protein